MEVAVFSTKPHDKKFFTDLNKKYKHEITFFEAHLTPKTAILAKDFKAICVFVNDLIDSQMLEILKGYGIELIALRCAGFNNVDIKRANELGINIVRVPAYSPYAVAEHSIGLMLALNRKLHKSYTRVREGNFSLDGLIGFDMFQKTVGIIGTGKIGKIVINILKGFGCNILAYDVAPDNSLDVEYTSLDDIFSKSDIISLHCPLSPETYHIIDNNSIKNMKRGVMIINTSRGALVNAESVIYGLKTGKIGYLGLDVYEEEGDMFFEDLSNVIIKDDVFARLLTFPNVIITGHQAFFTKTALENIADTTLQNIYDFENGKELINKIF